MGFLWVPWFGVMKVSSLTFLGTPLWTQVDLKLLQLGRLYLLCLQTLSTLSGQCLVSVIYPWRKKKGPKRGQKVTRRKLNFPQADQISLFCFSHYETKKPSLLFCFSPPSPSREAHEVANQSFANNHQNPLTRVHWVKHTHTQTNTRTQVNTHAQSTHTRTTNIPTDVRCNLIR